MLTSTAQEHSRDKIQLNIVTIDQYQNILEGHLLCSGLAIKYDNRVAFKAK